MGLESGYGAVGTALYLPEFFAFVHLPAGAGLPLLRLVRR
jgi:hypothetical protein